MRYLLALAVILAPAMAAADEPFDAPARDRLAGELRDVVLKKLPQPLYEGSQNWGRQSDGKKLKLRGKLRDIHIEVQHPPKNDGTWRKVLVVAERPEESFDLRVLELARAEDGVLTGKISVACDVFFDITGQRWLMGAKLFDGSVRGHMRVTETLGIRAVTRWERNGLLPELVLTASVTESHVGYVRLKFEHVAGLGGEAAEVLGETAHAALSQWKPSLERHLLEKADAAVVKAGESREVRLGVGKLFKK